MKRRNYKVYAFYRDTHHGLSQRMLSILDTGAGPNFVRRSFLSTNAVIRAPNPDDNIRDANGNRLDVMGHCEMEVQLGTFVTRATFMVCHNLAAPVILGCDYCDRFVEAIRPRQREVELTNGTTIPIVRKALTHDSVTATLSSVSTGAQEKQWRISSSGQIQLVGERQTWVPVTFTKPTQEARRVNTFMVKPHPRLFENRRCSTANGIIDVQGGTSFLLLVANWQKNPVTLQKGDLVALAQLPPESMADTSHTTADVLGLIDTNARDDQLAQPPSHSSPETPIDPPPQCPHGIDLPHVPPEYGSRVRKMLQDHSGMWNGQLGAIRGVQHHIDLNKGARPFRSAPYRAGPTQRKLEEAEVKKQLDQGVIEPASSEWGSPILFVPKKDGKLRFCVDYRKLNALTKRDSYPIPRIDECLDSLGDASYFSSLDANSGYWQLKIAEADREKTAFVCHAGTFQYRRMPFGLTNAPATFQRALDVILSAFTWKTCIVYLDDVVIFSKDIEAHIRDVDKILTIMESAGLTLNIAKCHFFTKDLMYLGHKIRPGSLTVDPVTIKALREASPPINQSELRSFLGLANVYRRFIPAFAGIATPLYELLRKTAPVQLDAFGKPEKDAFDKLRLALTSAPILTLPRPGRPYRLETDASNYQLGCTLLQEGEDSLWHPVGYWSRKLIAAERHYSTTEKECLAVVWAVRTLRPYLAFDHFTVVTDHASLRWLMTLTDPGGRLMRWRLRLAEYDFDVVYRRGADHHAADTMSRLETTGTTLPEPDVTEIPALFIGDDEHWDSDLQDLNDERSDAMLAAEPIPPCPKPSPVSIDELVLAQYHDVKCQNLRQQLDEGQTRRAKAHYKLDEDGLLVRTSNGRDQILVPPPLRDRILSSFHGPVHAGHPGYRKLYYTISRQYYWASMTLDCLKMVRDCHSCARERMKLRRHSKKMKLFPATEPLTNVSLDLLGPLLTTTRGNTFLLVMTDRYAKLTRTVPLKTATAGDVAMAFVRHWVFTYGPPAQVLTDNGKQFASRFFMECCRILQVENAFTTTYHPQCNGQVERFNRTILSAIRHYCADHPDEWDLFTDAITYAYNTQTHTALGVSPFQLILSRPPPSLSMDARPPLLAAESAKDNWLRWKRRLGILMETATPSLAKAQARYKANFDQHVRPTARPIGVGDWVYVRSDYEGEQGKRHKLAPVAHGPYVVNKVDDSTVVVLINDCLERVSRDRVALAPVPPSPSQPVAAQPTSILKRLQPGTTRAPLPVYNIIDRIVDHGAAIDEGPFHKPGDRLWRTRWYDQASTEDSWLPTNQLPRTHIVRYCRQRRLDIPENIDDADPG